MNVVNSEKVAAKTWIGWVLTVLISVVGSWMSMNARVYNTQSDIQVLKTRIEIVEKSYDRQLQIAEKQADQYSEIKQSLIRIEGVLNTKQDKQWK